jgi:hypothetical protein
MFFCHNHTDPAYFSRIRGLNYVHAQIYLYRFFVITYTVDDVEVLIQSAQSFQPDFVSELLV